MSIPIVIEDGEIDFKVILPNSPKHIAMIKVCPKKRKGGDYVMLRFKLKKLDIPAENAEQANADSQRLLQSIIENEVKPLLEQILANIPEMSKDCLNRNVF